MNEIPLKQALSEALKAAGHDSLTIFVGAGVSMLPPTNLPSGWELRDLALDTVCAGKQFEEFKTKLKQERLYQELLPERLFQIFFHILRKDLYPFFDLLANVVPNPCHAMINNLYLKYKVPVLTTNFDLLLEAAGLPSTAVTHIHGGINDPESMIMRIFQVGRGLSDELNNICTPQLVDKTVLVLGYSGADADVRKLLTSSQPHRIIWLSKTRASRNKALLQTKLPIDFAYGDLNDLPAMIGGKIVSPGPASSSPRSSSWAETFSEAIRWACLAKVIAAIDKPELAEQAFLKGAAASSDPRLRGWHLTDAAACCNTLGETSRGLKYIKQAKPLAPKGHEYMLGEIYRTEGVLYMEAEAPNLAKAQNAFKQALSIFQAARRRRTSEFTENILDNLGMSYNNLGLCVQFASPQTAEKYYRKALRYKRKAGNLTSQAITCANLCILFARINQSRKETIWKHKAKRLITEFNLVYLHGYLSRELGTIKLENGEYGLAANLLRESQEVFIELGLTGIDLDLVRVQQKRLAGLRSAAV